MHSNLNPCAVPSATRAPLATRLPSARRRTDPGRRMLWRGVLLGWLLGVLTFAAGMLVSANLYEHRTFSGSTITAAEWQQLGRDGCEPVSTPAGTILSYRCPRLRLH